METKPEWLKTKGYIHLTPNISVSNWKSIIKKLENAEFISNYNFFPLIHRVIKERKFKKVDSSKHILIPAKVESLRKQGKSQIYRAHKHRNSKSNQIEPTRKDREIFYASHFDAIIYSYYSNLINNLYCTELRKNEELDQCVIAYRKIPLKNNVKEAEGKSTIHFSKEVFDEIERQSKVHGEVAVLAFDITNFFPSMNHDILKEAWKELVGNDEFDKHHKRIFEACTNFRYVNFNDLKRIENKRSKGFNESRLNSIRKTNGIKCVFGSYAEFREAIKNKQLRVFNPNYRRKTQIKGIPQGLPISATLANIYLLQFDKTIVNDLVENSSAFYRRYSDDIIIVCPFDKISIAESKVESLIHDVELEISTHKTDRYKFKMRKYGNDQKERLECFLLDSDFKEIKPSRLIYLGFEYYGYQTLIKSANLAKYYRRLIKTVTRRAKRVDKAIKNEPTIPRAIFYNQIKKIINKPLKDELAKADSNKHYKSNKYILKKDLETGLYKTKILPPPDNESPVKKRSTYMGYIKRCVKIHKSSKFLKQLRKRKHILNMAIKRKLNYYSS